MLRSQKLDATSSLKKLVNGKPHPFDLKQLLISIAIISVLIRVQGRAVGRIKSAAWVAGILKFCTFSFVQHFDHLWSHLHLIPSLLDWLGLECVMVTCNLLNFGLGYRELG